MTDAASERAGAYGGARPDVQALVPEGARRVLDVGCAGGALGEALKLRQGCEVVGIELDAAYADEACRRLDLVLQGDAATALRTGTEKLGRFDALIAADVLEHLVDPWEALRDAAALLEPGGTAVLSLPNVRFFETYWQLAVRGRWPREQQGIFDATHLRWFTLRDARELARQAGLTVAEVRPLIRVRPIGSRFDRLFGWLARTPLRELFAFQYLLRCEKPG
jgi:methionine biosynthesis protein MetW